MSLALGKLSTARRPRLETQAARTDLGGIDVAACRLRCSLQRACFGWGWWPSVWRGQQPATPPRS